MSWMDLMVLDTDMGRQIRGRKTENGGRGGLKDGSGRRWWAWL
jgi:hypothetical protein